MEDNFDIDLELEIINDKEYDSHISRCYGLIEGSALRKADNQLVNTVEVTKANGPFYCPVCLSDAVVRKCSEKVDHFAHHARQSPIIRRKDKELHTKCRDKILEHLINIFPDGKWAKEREIPANKEKDYKKVIPDISGRVGDIPVAIEVQASAYTINRISTKIIEYQKRNPKVAVLYIVPLTEELGTEPFRPRLFEKYLHNMYFGRVYYWTQTNEALIQPVHFGPAKRWIEETTWFDTEIQEQRTEGGFLLTYRTIKTPNFANYVDIAKDFVKAERKEFIPKNVKKAVPEGTVFKDNLREWWDKNEYKNAKNQFAIFNDRPKPKFIEAYETDDDYDEE